MLNGKPISRELWGHYVVDSAMHIILFDLLMHQNEIRENFIWWRKRTSEIPIEVLSKDVVTGFEEAHINLSDIDFYSKNITIKEDVKCELCVQYIII